MSSLFALLILVSLVGLVWGLIAPHHIARATKIKRPLTRAHTGLGFGILIMLFLILDGVMAPSQQQNTAKNTSYSTATSTTSQVKGDNVVFKQETATQSVAFSITDQNDSSLTKGQTKIVQTGKNGVETLTYQVTYTNGKQTSKTLQSTKVTTQPADQVVDVGTYVAPVPRPQPTSAPTPPPTPAPTPTPPPAPSCYPLSNEGTCYEPGEYCRDSDHGTTGVAGDGKSIVCADNDSWRWEAI